MEDVDEENPIAFDAEDSSMQEETLDDSIVLGDSFIPSSMVTEASYERFFDSEDSSMQEETLDESIVLGDSILMSSTVTEASYEGHSDLFNAEDSTCSEEKGQIHSDGHYSALEVEELCDLLEEEVLINIEMALATNRGLSELEADARALEMKAKALSVMAGRMGAGGATRCCLYCCCFFLLFTTTICVFFWPQVENMINNDPTMEEYGIVVPKTIGIEYPLIPTDEVKSVGKRKNKKHKKKEN